VKTVKGEPSCDMQSRKAFNREATIVNSKSDIRYTDEEIARRRDDAIRRALNTPPKPLKEFVGKSKRAIAQRKSRVRKSAQSEPKSSEA
jgi:hypothetical protein